MGRFISADPTIQHPYDPQDFNRYAYARNNPIKYIDPTGYGFWDWLKSFWKAIVAVAIIVVTAIVMVVAPQTAPVTFPMLLGQMTFGITGGVSAAIRGGDVGAGMLFGVAAATLAGLSLGAMGPLPAAEAGAAHVWGAMAEGAIVGTAAGATTAYAGGKGSIQEVIFWAAMGNISGAVLNGIGAALKAANPSTQAVAEVGKESKDAFKPVAAAENEYGVNAVENAIDPIKAKEMRQERVLQKALLLDKTKDPEWIGPIKIIKDVVDIFKGIRELIKGGGRLLKSPKLIIPLPEGEIRRFIFGERDIG